MKGYKVETKRTRRLVQTTVDEKTKLAATKLARREGLTLSAFVRRLILRAVGA